MRDVLIVMCNMGKGGVSKSLASLLNCIDFNKYNVDLFLFRREGLFMSQIPQKVNLLPQNESTFSLLKKGHFWSVFRARASCFMYGNEENLEKKWSIFWKNCKGIFQKSKKRYDVAVAYNDGVELYYVIDCVDARLKCAINHTDYTNSLCYKPNLDRPYYEKSDYIVTVSDICREKLAAVFPEMTDKIQVIENIVDKEQLMSMAGIQDPFKAMFEDRENIIVISTVAGLYLRKGFDLMASALGKLKSKGLEFRWIIIGIGPDGKKVKDCVKDAGICSETVFLYEQSNPYPYVRWSDIFALASYAEGKSIAVEEAKLLERPILITNYSSAYDQIQHEKNGIIADLDVNSVENGLERLVKDAALRSKLSLELRTHCKSNKEENLEKIYKIWG